MLVFHIFWLSLSSLGKLVFAHQEICGVTHPAVEEAGMDLARVHRLVQTRRRRLEKNSCQNLCKQCIEIETKFHLMVLADGRGGFVMPHPTETILRQLKGDDTLTLDDYTSLQDYFPFVGEQMNVLNQAYADTPFRFKYVGATRSNLWEWILWPMDHRRNFTNMIGQKDPTKLDIYVSFQVESQHSNNTDRTGFADFPSHQYVSGDGIYVRADSLPGGGGDEFGLWHAGYTVVHEVGHWLGLYHTFENWGVFDPCAAESWGDLIDDTPAMAEPTSSAQPNCTVWANNETAGAPGVDTCPLLPGTDPVHNFMNYLDDDSCYVTRGEFTCHQIERMYFQWLLYRESVDLCGAGEKELEFVFRFDESDHFREDGLPNSYVQLLEDDNTSSPQVVIFDSRYDHEPSQVARLQDSLFVDLCVNASKAYLFGAFDEAGNGFAEGAYAEVFFGGESVARIEGNFGSESIIPI